MCPARTPTKVLAGTLSYMPEWPPWSYAAMGKWSLQYWAWTSTWIYMRSGSSFIDSQVHWDHWDLKQTPSHPRLLVVEVSIWLVDWDTCSFTYAGHLVSAQLRFPQSVWFHNRCGIEGAWVSYTSRVKLVLHERCMQGTFNVQPSMRCQCHLHDIHAIKQPLGHHFPWYLLRWAMSDILETHQQHPWWTPMDHPCWAKCIRSSWFGCEMLHVLWSIVVTFANQWVGQLLCSCSNRIGSRGGVWLQEVVARNMHGIMNVWSFVLCMLQAWLIYALLEWI